MVDLDALTGLLALRIERGWSMVRLAQACAHAGHPSLTRSTIAKLESGVRKTLSAAELAGLAQALDRTPDQLLAAAGVLVLWPEEEREALFALLQGAVIKDLVPTYRRIAGTSGPELPAEVDVRDVFLTLETLNAGPLGLPRPVEFVEHLASGLRGELSIELRRWADRQASRLNVINELQQLRRSVSAPPPGPPPGSPAYVVMLIRRVGVAGDQYQLGHWSQLDLAEGWRPERGEDFTGTLDEIKRHVAILVEGVETRWARYQPDIRIEFVLSGELLNLDVDQWPSELDDTPLPPLPLGCRYNVAIRSLERMQTGKWHRSWHMRWRVLVGQLKSGVITRESVRQFASDTGLREMVADLETNPAVVALTLRQPPDSAAQGGDEVFVGLRAGLPCFVWSREDCSSEDFLVAVSEILHGDGPGDILNRVKLLRTAAYRSHAGHVGHHLAVLWDDPDRLVVPADSGPPRGQEA